MNLQKLTLKVQEIEKRHAKKQAKYAYKYPAFDLKFKKRSGLFVNYKSSCVIDVINEVGYSYNWWQMLKRINGKLVLNSYRYSVQTSKHISKARQVLNELGIKFIEVEAPKGLQDLNSALDHYIHEQARVNVQNKYARILDKRNFSKEIEFLRKAKAKTRYTIKTAEKVHEIDREARLQRQRDRRFALMQMRSNSDVRPTETPTLRLVEVAS